MNRGKFIVLEGIDKSGKDTQARFLAQCFEEDDQKVFLTFEPTDKNIFGKLVHFILKYRIKIPAIVFQRLYYFDRRLHVKEIETQLKHGYIVICVRYFFSTMTYGYSGGMQINKIAKWHANILLPDLVIFIKISIDEAIRRLELEGGRGEFFEKRRRLEKVAEGYEKCFDLFPDLFVMINGEQPVREVSNRIKLIYLMKF